MTLMQISTDEHVASAYSNAMVGTGYLAYRDLDVLIKEYVKGSNALDFGCGRGRSSRFLSELGFQVDAIDICPHMIKQAAQQSLDVNYLLASDFKQLQAKHSYDFILAQLILVEITTEQELMAMLKQQSELLKPGGILIHTTTSDDFLSHSWANIDTHYPSNAFVTNGKSGRIKLTNRNLVLESACWHKDYLLSKFEETGFELLHLHQPLGQKTDPYQWQEELFHSPYNIFVLKLQS